MKYLIVVLLLSFFNTSYACGYKDYDCIKQQKNQNSLAVNQHTDKYNKDYHYNQKYFVYGNYDQTPVQLDSHHNHNIRIYAHNSHVTSNHSDAAIVSIDNSSRHNNITLNATGNIRNTSTNNDIRSSAICVSLVCNHGDNAKGITVNIKDANITNTVK